MNKKMKKLLLILILICVICLHAVVNRVQEKEKFQDLTHNAHRTVLLFCDTIGQKQKYQNVSFEKMLGAYTSVMICLSEWEHFRKETCKSMKCRICENQCKFENQSVPNGIITKSLYYSADEIFLDTMKMYYLDEKRFNKEKEAKFAEKNEKIREMVPHFFCTVVNGKPYTCSKIRKQLPGRNIADIHTVNETNRFARFSAMQIKRRIV